MTIYKIRNLNSKLKDNMKYEPTFTLNQTNIFFLENFFCCFYFSLSYVIKKVRLLIETVHFLVCCYPFSPGGGSKQTHARLFLI